MVDMHFNKWLLLNEMASFSLPQQGKKFALPGCNVPQEGDCGKCVVGALDMRFEDYKPGLNQGSKFHARIPGSDMILVYHGWSESEVLPEDEFRKKQLQGYADLPEDWWKYAQVLSYPDFEVCKPALHDETGERQMRQYGKPPSTQQLPKKTDQKVNLPSPGVSSV